MAEVEELHFELIATDPRSLVIGTAVYDADHRQVGVVKDIEWKDRRALITLRLGGGD